MNLLLLKLLLTPTLIGLASLAGRRWGHAISGWIVALPLTSGPIVFFLALTHGPAFAADTAAGILTGALSVASFVMVYGRLAQRWVWLPTLAASAGSFFTMTAILRPVHVPLVPLWAAVMAALALALRLLPRDANSARPTEVLPGWWDIPLRMLVATVFVFFITGLAPATGPHLAGLLAPFPIFTATLSAFAQHQYGGLAAIQVLRGLLLGLFSFTTFMFALAALLIPAGIGIAFAAAILVVILIQGITLWRVRSTID